MIRRVASPVVLVFALLAAACIVTDKIEFEDLVNHPPEVLSFDPSNEHIRIACSNDELIFTVHIWDPDDRDATTYAAKLFMWIDPAEQKDPNVPRECDVSPLPATEGEQVEGLETGIRLTVECKIDLTPYQGVEGELLLIKVQVSDLGYAQSELPEGARTAEVLWVYLVEEFACGDF